MTELAKRVELPVTADVQEADDAEAIAAGATRYLEELCTSLGLPLAATLALESTDPPGRISIGDRCGTLPLADRRPEGPVARIGLGLHRHREFLVTAPVAAALWNDWAAVEAGSGAVLGFEKFHTVLRESVRWGRSVGRLRSSLRRQRQLSPDDWLEATLAEAGTPEMRILLSPSAHARILDSETGGYRPLEGEERDFGGMLQLLSEGLFYELGIPLRVLVAVDERLGKDDFRLEWNDTALPPQRGLAADTFMVNDTVERLRLVGLEGESATNPANGRETTLVRGGPEAREKCEALGLTTWGPEGYVVLVASAELRHNAGAFLTTALGSFLLEQLTQVFPDLVRAATNRFDATRLTRVLRTLLDEEIGIRDLPTVLEALLALEGTTSADFGERIILSPNTGTALPVRNGRDMAALTAEELAECVRVALRRYISHKYTLGENTLLVYLLHPDLEARIVVSDRKPLTTGERDTLLRAVRTEVESLPATARQPVILTSIEVRRRMRLLIEHDLPHMAVLSYSELSPDMNIQPIGRVSLN